MNSLIKELVEFTAPNGDYVLQITFPAQTKFEMAEIRDLLAQNKQLECDIHKYVKKRSSEANRYFWVLCDKIATLLRTTKESIYRDIISRVGVWTALEIDNDAVDRFNASWERNGLGWITQVVGPAETDPVNKKQVFAYYGSSTYNSEEMSRIIDETVFIAQENGIETKTPDEIADMISLMQSVEKQVR